MKPYNPEFVKKILESHQSVIVRKTTRINISEL